MAFFATPAAARQAQPNPPQWPEGVFVWGPDDDAGQIEAAVNDAFNLNGYREGQIDHGQFSPKRFAFMFKPGTYHVDVPVGYYTQVLGLGTSPDDVIFDSGRGVYSVEGDQIDMGGALSTFWRSAENFRNRAEMLWAVSQAAPLRRVVVEKSLNLAQYVDGVGMGYSSGGYLGNCRVYGMVNSASQQQWFARNLQVEAWPQGNWNMVFVGVNGAPASSCGRNGDSFPSTNVEEAPIIAEKPFVTVGADGKFSLQIPELKKDRAGYDFDSGKTVPFEEVYVAKPTDTATEINEYLKKGLHCVLAPGVYQLDAPLELNTEGQVLLGLGLATLEATAGTAAVKVGNVDGVRVAGVLLQAGKGPTDALLEWGDGGYQGNVENPGVMSDLFARVGGPNDPDEFQVQARIMVRIRSGHVIGDNLWLWRADHGVAGIVKASMNPCDSGLVVLADHVTMYGLAVEHTLKDLVQWAGDDGRTYFFQSELPYDVGQGFGDADFVGYRVNDSVSTHKAYGVGVYHFFRDFEVTVPRGIACPDWLENSFENPLSVSLTGKGTVSHVINDKGEPTHGDASTSWYCEKGPELAPRPVKTTPEPSTRRTTAKTTPEPSTQRTTAKKTSEHSTQRTARPPARPSTSRPSAATDPNPTPASAPALDPAPAPAPKSHSKSHSKSNCSKAFKKCGGRDWEGPTCCTEGYACVEHTHFTHVCIPDKGHKLTAEDELEAFGVVVPAKENAPAPTPVVAEEAASDAAWDCSQGRDDWQKRWEEPKQKWCCEHEFVGCAGEDEEGDVLESAMAAVKEAAADLAAAPVPTPVGEPTPAAAPSQASASEDLGASLARASEDEQPDADEDEQPAEVEKKPWESPWSAFKLDDQGRLIERLDQVQKAPVVSQPGALLSPWTMMFVALQASLLTAVGAFCWLQRQQRRRDPRVAFRAARPEGGASVETPIRTMPGALLSQRSPAVHRAPRSPGIASPLQGRGASP